MKPVVYTLIISFLVWAGASWFLSKNSQEQFDQVIESLNSSQLNNVFELEASHYESMFFSASTTLKVIPTAALLDDLAQRQFVLRRQSGPVFINHQGVQFGSARWQLLEVVENEQDHNASSPALNSEDGLLASVLVSFSEVASFQVDLEGLAAATSSFEVATVSGNINLKSLQHEITVRLEQLYYQHANFKLRIPEATMVSMNANKADPDQPLDANLTSLKIDAPAGELMVQGELKKIPLNLQSNGSIWVNNDTLSSDWQINLANGHLTDSQDASVKTAPEQLRVDVNLQFRELLLSGFEQYLKSQSDIFHLLQQADWAMEEVETPEQQDFLRSLFVDAERIEQSLLDSPLKPLLIKDRSQLAVNAEIRSEGEEASRLSLGGAAAGSTARPELALKGHVKIVQNALDKRWQSILERWGRRRWFRRYETVYESDITLRKEQLLLNNFIVSVDRLSAELSRPLTDQ